MDIELKKVRYSFWFKILAWVLCVGCALGAFAFLIKLRGGAEVITDQYVEYSGSKHYFNYMNNQLHDVFYGYGEPGKDDIAHVEEVYSLYNEKEGMLAAIEERYNTEGDRINAPELLLPGGKSNPLPVYFRSASKQKQLHESMLRDNWQKK